MNSIRERDRFKILNSLIGEYMEAYYKYVAVLSAVIATFDSGIIN